MKRFSPFLALLALVVILSGCGGSDRAALAQSTVQRYWDNIAHAQMNKSYVMLTTGNRASRKYSDYVQDMFGFLEGTSGISVKVGKAEVNGDTAVVPVALHSPRAAGYFHAFQHLFWEDGEWRITDQNGGLSQSK